MHARVLLAPILILFSANLTVAQAAGHSENSFTVSGAQTWLDTGIDIAPGNSVFVAAEAKSESDTSCSPEGTQGTPAGDKAPLPSEPKGALIARSGEASGATLIGKNGQLNVGVQGRLFLGINQ